MEDSDQIFPDIQVCIFHNITLYLIAQWSRLSTHPGLTLDILGKSHLERRGTFKRWSVKQWLSLIFLSRPPGKWQEWNGCVLGKTFVIFLVMVYNIACIPEQMPGREARAGVVAHGICCLPPEQYQLRQPWCWAVKIPSGGLGPVSCHLWGSGRMAWMEGTCDEASGKCQHESEMQVSKGGFNSLLTPCN